MFSGCSREEVKKPVDTTNIEETQKEVNEINLNIAATNRLSYFMVKDIVKDKHSVIHIFSSTNDMWNFEYEDNFISNINGRDLLFYWGSGIEPWIDGFVDKLNKEKVSPINISRGIKLLSLTKEIKYKENFIKENPYFWLNIDNYKIAMLNIKNAIQDKDTKNRDFYEKNFNESIKQIEEIQKALKEEVDKFKDYTFVVDGDELDYFISYYGIKTIKLKKFDDPSLPEAKEELEKITKFISEAGKLIFLYDDLNKITVNESLLQDYNMKTLNISVIKEGTKYTGILEGNLVNLQKLSYEIDLTN
jgi:ABC-type Zn uptake system ZnuABC Zn-binding protein ZnuA